MKRYIMFISSMLIFGTIGIFRRYIPISSGMMAVFRGIIGSLFLYIYIRFRRAEIINKIEKKQLFFLAVTGGLIGVNWIMLFEAYNYTTVATATMCYYMEPTIVVLISPIILREKLPARKLICAIFAMVGMVLVSGLIEGNSIGSKDIKGILFGLGAASLYASVVILNKKIVVHDFYQKTIIQLAAAAVVLTPYVLLTEDFGKIVINPTVVALLMVVGIVHTGIAYALYFGGMAELKAQSVAILSYIDPVAALILSAVILKERMSIWGIIGSAVIIASAMISERNNEKMQIEN